jgi:subtilisin family serine protease
MMIRCKWFYPSLFVFLVNFFPFLPDVSASSVSYLRKSSDPSDNVDTFQQNLPATEKPQTLSQDMAAVNDKPKRRFYARYEGEDGRRLVKQLCGTTKIVEDLDSSDYTLFEDVDGEGFVNDNVQNDSCWKKLQQRSEITWVEEDHPVQAFSMEGTDNIDATEINDAMMSWGIAAVQADQLEVGPHDVTVCVVDTGIASHHPDFDYDRISGVDRTDRPTTWYWNQDRAGHGTHVSGIVAASSKNGYGVKGVGDFPLLIVRALGDDGTGFESDIWKAVETCIGHGANIINMYVAS